MKRAKIAPMLQHFVAARTCHQDECGGDAECHAVTEELEALVELAWEAQRWTWTVIDGPRSAAIR